MSGKTQNLALPIFYILFRGKPRLVLLKRDYPAVLFRGKPCPGITEKGLSCCTVQGQALSGYY
ncbi:MAG: hypothetical protein IT269_03920 [Saprospiraceae bacterium]|nr:hypothetical protein [Saprospiraceae bacterium]